ncbi:MAG TPA: hypothetical protein VGJ15_01265, partial [Pirellulales bacterium]
MQAKTLLGGNGLNGPKRFILTIVLAVLSAGTARAVDEEKKTAPPPTAIVCINNQQWSLPSTARDYIAEAKFFRNELTLLKSFLVTEKVLADKEIAQLPVLSDAANPEKWLSEHLIVKQLDDSDFISIGMEGDDRNQSAKIINAVADAFLDVTTQATEKQFQREVQLLSEQHDLYEKKLLQLQQRYAMLSDQTGASHGRQQATSENLSSLNKLLTDVRQKQLKAQLRLAASEVRLEHSGADSQEANRAKTDIAIAKSQLELLQHKSDELNAGIKKATELASYSDSQLDLLTAEREVQRTNAMLEEISKRIIGLQIES